VTEQINRPSEESFGEEKAESSSAVVPVLIELAKQNMLPLPEPIESPPNMSIPVPTYKSKIAFDELGGLYCKRFSAK